jgi:VWFA-related protein
MFRHRAATLLRVFVSSWFICLLWIDSPHAAAQSPSRPVFRSGTELVLVNVVVRDRSGDVVRDLKPEDFSIAEDDRPQTIVSFDFEELDRAAVPGAAPTGTVLAPGRVRLKPDTTSNALKPDTTSNALKPPDTTSNAVKPETSVATPGAIDMHGRRLIVLLFDLSSMQPEEIERAVKTAHAYIDDRLSPADLVAVASFSTSLRVDQDFTADRETLSTAVDRFSAQAGQGFEEGTTGDSEGTPDNGAAFTPDDTEFNIFNTDRRLEALQTLSDALGGIQQKKSVVYFSSGMNQTGQENQVEIRRTTDRANRANVSIYAADMRGLQALVAGGEASQASVRGVSAFSGASTLNQVTHLSATQDTLTTIAEDTGGRAFFDSNDFGDVFRRVVADTSAYYVLGYSSTNPARDGKFRRIKVQVRRPGVKIEARSGYYAPRDFAHSTRDDREAQLEEQLLADLPPADLSAYASTAYFRLADERYFVAVSVIVPGYQLPFARTTDKSHSTLDVLGIVRDAQRRPVGRIRDTLTLSPESNDGLRRRIVQYETGLEMPPGTYDLKVVVRENLTGTMGSFEAPVVVPDVRQTPVRLSSVVVGTSIQPLDRKNKDNPLVKAGRELIPNVTHVVSSDQHLYFYYEVYDPARSNGDPRSGSSAVRVLTSITFFRGRVRAFETPPVEATEVTDPARKTAVFQFDVPAASLQPGVYTCQVNVIDDAAGTFAFPRLQLLVRR